jgi:hypothetical protein
VQKFLSFHRCGMIAVVFCTPQVRLYVLAKIQTRSEIKSCVNSTLLEEPGRLVDAAKRFRPKPKSAMCRQKTIVQVRIASARTA